MVGVGNFIRAQDSTRLSYATAIGLIKITEPPDKIFQSALAFSSELEYINTRRWFADLAFDLSSLKYSQLLKDDNSPFLLHNSKSSLLMLGMNGGKKLGFIVKNSSVAFYAGGGYIAIGEPRANIIANSIIQQTTARKRNVFARLGSRLEYATHIKILQGIYLDVSWWTSPVQIQGHHVKGLSFFVGTRVPIL